MGVAMNEITSPQSASMILLVLAFLFASLALFLGFAGKGGRRVRRMSWSATGCCLAIVLAKAWLFEPFYVPSASMAPAILEGDVLIVQKYPYRLSWPVGEQTMFRTGNPQRSDVVIFSLVKSPDVRYVKRVIGMPGDDVVFLDGTWYVNAKSLGKEAEGVFKDIRGSQEAVGLGVSKEVLAGRRYRVLEGPSKPSVQHWKVPEGHLFVLGDNRGMSLDSRDFGFVQQDRVLGRASRVMVNIKGMDRWFRLLFETSN